MLRYVTDQPDRVSLAVSRALPGARDFGACTALGVLDQNGVLIAGVVYHHWFRALGTIEMAMAALPRSGWLTRETLRRMYDYPFLQLGCQLVQSWQSAEDTANIRQLEAYGYSFVRIPRFYGRNLDGILCQLTDDAWRNNKFNKNRRLEIQEAA